MRIGNILIRPLMLRREQPAFFLMQQMYEEFKDPKLNFWDDFADYALNGFIRISPTAMALARPCNDKDGDYWFIRAAVGPLHEVLCMLPYYLPRISWCRENDGIIRMYSTNRLAELVRRQNVSETMQVK